QESGAAIDSGLKQAHALVSSVPAFYDDVVQLVAQKFVDDVLILSIYVEEVGQSAHWRKAAAEGVGLEELADSIGRVAVLADESVERIAPSGEGGTLRAEAVATALGLGFIVAFGRDVGAQRCDFGFKPLQSFGDGLELH